MSANDKKTTLKRSRSDSPEPPPANRRKSSFITAEYSGKKWPIWRNTSYSRTINSVRASFDDLEGLENENIKLYSAREGCNDGVEIAEEVWSELAPCLSTIKVVLNPPLPQIVEPKPSKRVRITLHPPTYDGGFSMVADSTLTIRRLESIIRKRFPHIPDIRLVFDGRRMKGGTLASCGVEDGDEIDIMSDRMGGGPVIRLFTTSPIVDLRVQLSIVKTWPVAVNYPPTMATSPSDDSLGEMIYWIVNPSHDRPSFDRSTNREATYLSWAARWVFIQLDL